MVKAIDVNFRNIIGCDYFMIKDQFEYCKHTQLTVDITTGRGASFSLEIPMGIRFVIKSRLYTDDEREHLEPLQSTSEEV